MEKYDFKYCQKIVVLSKDKRKDEEVGKNFRLKLHLMFSLNLLYKKKDGASMILLHYLAIHEDGEVSLNEKYSEYKWVKLEDLEKFEPKIANIPSTIASLLRLGEILEERESFII